ncbi:hypothetical protein DFH09DRAFT_427795 [Mycena vulgaris]|nr:hypothetical protein DFH09DRAFT_427795 [Mycena vulgaris]
MARRTGSTPASSRRTTYTITSHKRATTAIHILHPTSAFFTLIVARRRPSLKDVHPPAAHPSSPRRPGPPPPLPGRDPRPRPPRRAARLRRHARGRHCTQPICAAPQRQGHPGADKIQNGLLVGDPPPAPGLRVLAHPPRRPHPPPRGRTSHTPPRRGTPTSDIRVTDARIDGEDDHEPPCASNLKLASSPPLPFRMRHLRFVFFSLCSTSSCYESCTNLPSHRLPATPLSPTPSPAPRPPAAWPRPPRGAPSRRLRALAYERVAAPVRWVACRGE